MPLSIYTCILFYTAQTLCNVLTVNISQYNCYKYGIMNKGIIIKFLAFEGAIWNIYFLRNFLIVIFTIYCCYFKAGSLVHHGTYPWPSKSIKLSWTSTVSQKIKLHEDMNRGKAFKKLQLHHNHRINMNRTLFTNNI